MTSVKNIARVLMGLGATGPAAGVADTYKGYEQPDYVVERTIGDIEIRDYASHLVAAVTVDGGHESARSQGFRILAGYIFGKNGGTEKIEMTAPVSQEPAKIDMTVPVTQEGGDGRWTVTFMMPPKWTRDTLPTPDDSRIRLEETAPERLAVLTFSGLAGAGRVAGKSAELEAAVADAGLTTTGPVRAMFYDDPFTLPWRRRNEVAVPIAR